MRSSASTAYVYEHWRPDKNEPFYVGKGHGKRAYSMDRNSHWLNIYKKLLAVGLIVEVRKIAEGLSNSEALALEIERIAYWRARGVKLTNLTDGGQGLNGFHLSKATKLLLREATTQQMSNTMARARIGNAVRQWFANPENVKKFSLSQRSRPPESDETRHRRRISHLGKTSSVEHKNKISRARTVSLSGQRFGRLIVSDFHQRSPGVRRGRSWLCQCDCGNTKFVNATRLRSGDTKSCGCLHREASRIKMSLINARR